MQTLSIASQNSHGAQRLLIIAPPNSYRTVPYVDAARSLGVVVTLASAGKHLLTPGNIEAMHLPVEDPEEALNVIGAVASESPFTAILGTDDSTIELAARAAQMLGHSHNSPESALLTRRKDLGRQCLRSAGMTVPDFQLIDLRQSLSIQAGHIDYPCVVKPLAMSGSRGVIRADNKQEFIAACQRIEKIIVTEECHTERRHLLAESFVPGSEIAVEGLLTQGKLEILTIFDKPVPLNGPYFEESYYVTPTGLDQPQQILVRQQLQAACHAYGLREGPIHAECRINEQGVWIIEIAARTIGGLCARLFQFGTGYSLEEMVISHALQIPVRPQAARGSVGVLMIPIPAAGILRRVEGLMAAQKTPYIDELVIYIREGYELVPLPEGNSYLGFIYARSPLATQTLAALREAHAQLNIVISQPLPCTTVAT